MDKVLAFQKALKEYVDEKNKVFIKLSQLMKILQNQIEHYDYVKSTKPSQDFLAQFENVQTIVLEKITKRIEGEMKTFVDLRSQYLTLFNKLKVSVGNFIKVLKIEEDPLKTANQVSSDTLSVSRTEELNRKDLNTFREKSKRKSNSSVKVKLNDDLVVNCMTPDGICVVREMVREIILLENLNIIKLMQMNTYEMVKVFNFDNLLNINDKFRSIDQLLKCFCENFNSNPAISRK